MSAHPFTGSRITNMPTGIKSLFWIILVILALIAGFLVSYATSLYGIGLSQDSVVYMAAAQNIAAGNGITSYNGTPVTLWPPLYPFIVALFGLLTRSDVVVVARSLNILLAVIVVLLTGIYARQLKMSDIPALGAAAITAWSFPIVATRVMAWSEPLFLVFVVLSLMALTRYITHRTVYSLLFFTIAASLAAVTRYIGVVMIPIGLIVILLFSKTRRLNRLTSALAVSLIASIPLLAFLIRNWLVSGSIMGPRHPPTITLLANALETARVIAGWFLPANLSDNGFVVLAGVLIVQLLLVAAFLEYRRTHDPKQSALLLYAPILLFIVFYIAFLLFSTTTTNLNLVNDRYLIPVFVPLMLVIFGSLSIIIEEVQVRLNKAVVAVAFMLLTLLLLAWPLRVTLASAAHWRDNGEGFNAAIWDRNETIQYLKENPSLFSDKIIYSNYPHAIFAHFRLASESVPYHYYVGTTNVLWTLDALSGKWPSDDALVVWFDWGDWQTHLYRPEELAPISRMSVLATTADGTIWHASPLSPH